MENTNTALGTMEHHITAYGPCICTYAVITEGYCLCFACELQFGISYPELGIPVPLVIVYLISCLKFT